MALCSLSTGSKREPDFWAAAVINFPARTSNSLLASAISFLAAMAARVGCSPAVPTTAETTVLTSGKQATSVSPSTPSKIRTPLNSPEARAAAAAAGSAKAIVLTLNSLTGAISSRQRECAASPATDRRVGWARTTARVVVPIEPVAPRIAIGLVSMHAEWF